MAYEWGRFVWWLNQNSGAIQAVTSVVIALLTVVLAYCTVRALRTSDRALRISQGQLQAMLQPIAELAFTPGPHGESVGFDQKTFWQGGVLDIKNVGTAPLKIQEVSIVVQLHDYEKPVSQYEVPIEKYRNRVITPITPLSEKILFDIRANADKTVAYGVHLDCSDMSALQTHSFYWLLADGLQHEVKD
jgi:hypothetical protein